MSQMSPAIHRGAASIRILPELMTSDVRLLKSENDQIVSIPGQQMVGDGSFLFNLFQQALIDLDILGKRASNLFFHTERPSELRAQIGKQFCGYRITVEARIVWCPVGHLDT